jgi:transcriptional regulator with XRE-family HTH domain
MITPIKRLRKSAQLTQATVAAMVGIDPRTLRRWENGEAEAPLMYRMLMTAASELTVDDDSAGAALSALSERARQP